MSSGIVLLSSLSSAAQGDLFSPVSQTRDVVAITPFVTEMLSRSCVVAIGVSGGKDSQACALRTVRYLDEVGHIGPRVLVHADLGDVEWKDSLPSCQRLASHLGLDLIVVRRRAGDMLTRWQQRWKANVARYRNLSCVRLILPWSTPSMRFCTSELKVAPITAALKRRYPCHAILNVSGIRRQESAARSRMPIARIEKKLQRRGYPGLSWNPIIEWTLDDVLTEIHRAGLALHEAYTAYGTSRVSCVFCIMSSASDLTAAAGCDDNHAVYRAMVALEAESSFAFQGTRWLGDVAPHLLTKDLRAHLLNAKEKAQTRREIEGEIPNHLLYKRGWPTSVPTSSEAALLARVRQQVSSLLQLNANYLTAESIQRRYEDLLAEKQKKDENSRSKPKSRRAA